MYLPKVAKLLLLMCITHSAYAQDPSFSQFFSSPLNVNPALTAKINGKWRLISNLRDQWVSPASPYATGTISFDTKALQNKLPENSVFGIGGMLMYDQGMAGALRSNYASLNLSYNIKLAENEGGSHFLGFGAGLTYGKTQVDYSKFDFEQQFAGYGFNTSLPTGETALTNMKGFLSANAGLIYTYTSQYTNFDLGVAGYHLNKPKQTVLDDPRQRLAQRYVIHSNFEAFLTDKVVLNTNAIFQTQAKASYFSIGGALGYFLSEDGEDDVIFNAGVWYWSNNAILPYVGLVYKNFQFGITYDVTVSKLSQASQKPKTLEFSFIIRGSNRPKGVIPCPWN